ncbi:hypothetical protein CCACVL1_25366 [Corchorus capsularis]|uniref:BSD domain-containing protein n=1 Tax=Corchorus capsularis TaxID=210143 RepID=A0A1R3GL08_COCAP|nr:hypothetical protein CCACVL1_25366 [Corchorus capsularis]
MDIWNKARSFAEEAAKRSSELTIGSAKLSDIVTEASKRSKEIAAEASKRADRIRVEAVKRADLIKSSLAEGIAPPQYTEAQVEQVKELERFGINEELRDFVKGITPSTFQDFPIPDDSPMSDVPTVSNVRQDLSEWQEKHAHLVLSTVKEISKLRYELCPRVMRERKFWRIYFILVNSHVAPFEKQYMEEIKQNSADQVTNENLKKSSGVEMTSKPEGKEITSKPEAKETKQPSKTSTSSAEQDLDVFLLGGDSDEGPDDEDGDFDDDFDKMVDSSYEEENAILEVNPSLVQETLGVGSHCLLGGLPIRALGDKINLFQFEKDAEKVRRFDADLKSVTGNTVTSFHPTYVEDYKNQNQFQAWEYNSFFFVWSKKKSRGS